MTTSVEISRLNSIISSLRSELAHAESQILDKDNCINELNEKLENKDNIINSLHDQSNKLAHDLEKRVLSHLNIIAYKQIKIKRKKNIL